MLRSTEISDSAPKIVVATTVGQWHDIGALTVALTAADYKGEGVMDADSELSKVAYPSEFDVSDSSISRELIIQYINAGILFPEEIRRAEELLRQTNEVTIISLPLALKL